MKWFAGDVVAAISKCKSEAATLVVYIKGDDDVSKSMDAVWDDESVTEVFSCRLCVPLALSVDSVGGQQFSQIYPVLSVPSTFFIGADGKPIEIIPSVCTVDALKQKAETVLKLRSEPSTSQTSEDTADSPQGASNMPDDCEATEDSGETEAEINANASYSEEEKAEKVKKAREYIAMKQRKKAEEEKEKARLAEIERRQLGKDLNRLKEFKAQQEAKETRDAIRKEKEETRLAREKVREQLQRDREARNAKFQQEKNEKAEALRKKEQEKLAREAEEAAKIAAANSSNARIQFRLPDGGTINHIFGAEDKLQAARDIVAKHEQNPLGSDFRLAAIYPRVVYTSDQYSKTFRDLGLVPTSALLVLPPAANGDGVRTTPTATGSISSLFSIIFAPLLLIWGFLQTFLFGGAQNPPVGQSSSQQQPSSDTSAQRGTRPVGADAPRRRVGRLSHLSSADDEQNTWNGNSTQQK